MKHLDRALPGVSPESQLASGHMGTVCVCARVFGWLRKERLYRVLPPKRRWRGGWRRGRGCVCLGDWLQNAVDLSKGVHPAPELGSGGENLCAGGESGVCLGACSTRLRKCPRRARPGRVRPWRWPAVGAVAAREKWLARASGGPRFGRSSEWRHFRLRLPSPAFLPSSGRTAGMARTFPGDPRRSDSALQRVGRGVRNAVGSWGNMLSPSLSD